LSIPLGGFAEHVGDPVENRQERKGGYGRQSSRTRSLTSQGSH
jgi:hypothetical protein